MLTSFWSVWIASSSSTTLFCPTLTLSNVNENDIITFIDTHILYIVTLLCNFKYLSARVISWTWMCVSIQYSHHHWIWRTFFAWFVIFLVMVIFLSKNNTEDLGQKCRSNYFAAATACADHLQTIVNNQPTSRLIHEAPPLIANSLYERVPEEP